MSDLILIDSYGWIEFFTKGPKFNLFKQHILSGDEILVSEIVLAEVSVKFHSIGVSDCKNILASITQRAKVVGITAEIADVAGQILVENKKKGMGLADAIILATAIIHEAVVVTGDKHFEGFPNAKIV